MFWWPSYLVHGAFTALVICSSVACSCSHCHYGERLFRSFLHNHLPLHDWALPHSDQVSYWTRPATRHFHFILAVDSQWSITLFNMSLWFTLAFPRQNGLGYTSFISRLGVSMSPLILLLDEVWTPLPQVIICTVAIISGLVSLSLPETLNMRLPETIDDIEKPK